VHPALADARWSVQDVYPVTDSQGLDVRATIEPPRTSIQYTMLYSEKGGFVRARLLEACNQLVRAHDILRTVFIEHESGLLQVVLKNLEVPVNTHRVEGEGLGKSVRALCDADADSDAFRLGSPFLRFFLVEGNEGQECLVIGLSHAQYDGGSLPRLLQDLETLYAGREIVPAEPLSSYIAQTRASSAQNKSLSYWATLLAGSSLSVLAGQSATRPGPNSRAIFRTSPIKSTAQPPRDITTATFLTAAWALVLARRLRTPDVTFGSITSGRATDLLPTAESVMGPCYQFTPVRVPFQPHWTAADLMQFVQRQGAESLAYDFVGYEAISKRVGWSSGSFFDSVVHHQDWDDFDEMPFAGGKCKVDIVNPHGDASRPVKVVSFVKEGKMHVGVVGSEDDGEFVDGVLAELRDVVQGLSGEGGMSVLLDDEVFSSA
jgi:fusarinine C synthase